MFPTLASPHWISFRYAETLLVAIERNRLVLMSAVVVRRSTAVHLKRFARVAEQNRDLSVEQIIVPRVGIHVDHGSDIHGSLGESKHAVLKSSCLTSARSVDSSMLDARYSATATNVMSGAPDYLAIGGGVIDTCGPASVFSSVGTKHDASHSKDALE